MTTLFDLNKNQKVIAIFFALLVPGMMMAQDKIPITSADQLPVRTINWEGKMIDKINDPVYLEAMRTAMEETLLSDLETYDIQDRSTLNSYYQSLLMIAFTGGEYEKSVELVAQVKSLIEKEGERLMAGNFVLSWVDAMEEAEPGSEAFPAAFQAAYFNRLSVLPIDKIREGIEGVRGNLQISSPELIKSAIEGQVQPMLDQMGDQVPESIGLSVISMDFTLNYRLPLRNQMIEVYDQILAAEPAAEKVNIWEDRDISLQEDDLTSVVIGVWDSGVDMEVFDTENQWINSADPIDGEDNDGNGFVDDYYGIAYDKEGYRTTSVLLPSEGEVTDLAYTQRMAKGMMDVQAAINSEEAAELREEMSKLDAESFNQFSEEVGFYGVYSHGTHVAGISQAGNPAAKILAARLTWSTRTIPEIPTIDHAKRTAQMYRDAVAYFQAHGVKVVNMSWRYNAQGYEGALAANNVGGSPEERKALAQEMFDIEKTALYEAFAAAPEILFVAGSGNENNDADFAGYIPAGFDLPNLITIGAVDSEGKKTSFTTEGKSVDFYANGYEVESYVPGGDRMKFSGTSMASPQVANLAGKLLAVNPELSPEQIIDLIREGATPSEEDPEILLINPAASVELARE